MSKRLFALVVLALILLPVAEAHGRQTRTYIASAGVTYGAEGFSTNRVSGPGSFTSGHGHYGVRITLEDTADLDPFIAACVDLTQNGFCDDAEGDLIFEGYGTIEAWATQPFDNVIIFSDAVQFDPDADTLHLSTRGTVKVDWLDGQEPATEPPVRERDAIEQLLHDLIAFVFGLGVL